jgi:hypothetical protein
MNDQNLKPVQPGEVRNPKGRPTGARNRKTLAKWIMTLAADEVLPESILVIMRAKYPNLKDMSVEEIMLLAQVAKSIDKRDTFAFNAVMDTAYGRPSQALEVSGEGGGPIQVIAYIPEFDPLPEHEEENDSPTD